SDSTEHPDVACERLRAATCRFYLSVLTPAPATSSSLGIRSAAFRAGSAVLLEVQSLHRTNSVKAKVSSRSSPAQLLPHRRHLPHLRRHLPHLLRRVLHLLRHRLNSHWKTGIDLSTNLSHPNCYRREIPRSITISR